jgi:hypothetical protein
VSEIFKISFGRILILLLLSPLTVNSQILRDTSSVNLVIKEIDNIYNLQFDEANLVLNKLNESYPENPIIYLIRGIITYWENYPLLPDSPARVSYESDMNKCMDLSGEKHDPADDAEYLLANLSARGMLLLFYADNDLSLDVVSLAPGTYQYIRRSFGYTNSVNDFHFFTGLYNYYREAYPEAYPVYKALAFLFPKGDRSLGLKELLSVARNSILYKAEAYSFLAYIYLGFEHDYDKAYLYSKSLYELYPLNIEYIGSYIKNSILVKHFDEAEKLMEASVNIDNPYYKAQLSIFNGLLQEKKYKNLTLAEQFYHKGIKDISAFGHYGNEFAAYGFFGLSRISDSKGDRSYKKTYHRKAVDLADFKRVDFSN